MTTPTERVAIALIAGLSAGVIAGTFDSGHHIWLVAAIGLGALLAVFWTWRHPGFGLGLFIVGVPLQQFVFARAFAAGAPFGLLALTRFWKEAVLVILLVRLLTERKWRALAEDRISLAYVAFVVLYMILPAGAPLNIRFLVARQIASFVLVFLVARHLVLPKSTARRLEASVLAMGLVAAALGVWNALDPTAWSNWIASTKLIAYQQAISGGRPSSPVVWYTLIGGRQYVSAGSIFLSPLVLPYYLAIPTTVALVRATSGHLRARIANAVVAMGCVAGIFFTLSRSAIGIAPSVALLAFAAMRRRAGLIMVSVVAAAVLLPIATLLPLSSRLDTAFNTQNASTAGHIARVRESVERISGHPLGGGLGSASGLGSSGEPALISEDWYLQVGADIGIAGMALVLLTLAAILRALWRRARVGSRRAVAALCALAWVSVGCVVLQVMSDINVSWTLWLLAGLALRDDYRSARSDFTNDQRVSRISGSGAFSQPAQLM
jgi:hypothetical protein